MLTAERFFSKTACLWGLLVLFVFLSILTNVNAQYDAGEYPPFNERTFSPGRGQEQQRANYVPGEVLVKFKEGADPQAVLQNISLQVEGINRVYSIKPAVNKFKNDYKLEKNSNGWYWYIGKQYQEIEQIPDEEIFKEAYNKMSPEEQALYRSYKIDIPEGISVEQAAAVLNSNPYVEYAEPNYIMEAYMLPNDPYYYSSGSWGQSYDDLWGLKPDKLNCEQAWDISQGEGVVVAVIDSGVDYNHEDIAANIWVNQAESNGVTGVDDDSNGYIDDIRGWDFANNDNDPMDGAGHGTHCAGTIAAVANNNLGIIGIAPMAKIMPVKGLSDSGRGSTNNLAMSVKYAADNGADILSNSWGGQGTVQTLIDVFHYAHSLGCVCIAAAGNDNMDVFYSTPANIDSVIAVAATDHNDIRADFSNYGSEVDVAAPGGDSGRMADTLSGQHYYVNILSLRAEDTDGYLGRPNYTPGEFIVGEHYYRSRGTSMACPYVAGLAALIKSAYPADSPDAIRSRIWMGADNIDSLNPDFEGLLGTGRINAYNSLTAKPTPFFKILALEEDNVLPGENGTIIVYLKNFWQDASGVVATLLTDNPQVTIQNNSVSFGDIESGQTKTNSANPFVIILEEKIPFGSIINFKLRLVCRSSYEQTFNFTVPVLFFKDILATTNLPSLTQGFYCTTVMRDYNNDDYADIFFSRWGGGNNEQKLFVNQEDGSFIDGTAEAGVYTGLMHYTSILMDIDNDGNPDLFTGSDNLFFSIELCPANSLFLNNGNGAFMDITEANNILNEIKCYSAVSFDYNNDGLIDIFGGGRGGLFLLKNNGDNTFIDIIHETGLPSGSDEMYTQIATFDYDNDGDQDLLFSYNGSIKLYRNNGNGTFTDVTEDSCIDTTRGKTVGVATGDYDNDGYIDIFLTGFGNFATNPNNNALYRNNGDGTFSNVTQEAGDVGLGAQGGSWGTDFFDYDNDGDLDLYITSSGIPGSALTTRIRLYKNNGDGTFTDVTHLAFPQDINPTSSPACIGDYNNDGALDIYAPANYIDPTSLGGFLQNTIGTKNNWIKIKLEGTASNRDSYGTRVYVKTGNLTQLREVHTSPVETQPLHFGLGKETLIDEIEVYWPSGKIQKLNNIDANQTITIAERQSLYVWSESFQGRKGWEELGEEWCWSNGGGWIYLCEHKTWVYLYDLQELFSEEGYYLIRPGWCFFFGNGWAWVQDLDII